MPKVYPVVHVTSPDQAREQAGVAFEAGADGVFLINHSLDLIVAAYNAVRENHEGDFVGVNFLVGGPFSDYVFLRELLDSGAIVALPNALWVDDALGGLGDWTEAAESLEALQRYRSTANLLDVIFFGGLSFKGTHHYSDDPETSVDLVHRFGDLIDVVTTSGPSTGFALTAEKLEAMDDAFNGEIAVASGVSIENILDVAGAGSLLVASSVETTPFSGRFVPARLAKLISLAHQLE